MAAPDVAAAMEIDRAQVPAPLPVFSPHRSRLNGDVRVRIGMPRTPAAHELQEQQPAQGRVRAPRGERAASAAV